MTEFIINSIVYLTLCVTLPYVCITAAITSADRLTKVSAIAALACFFYINIIHVALS